MNSLVSVIIPAYNAEGFITEALDSVFSQTYRPLEIIVIDDGSTDKTSEIIKNYQRSPSNKTDITSKIIKTDSPEVELRYLYQNNSGPSKARNAGIKAAKGEYIAFLDADDLWTSDKLDKQMHLFKREHRIDVVFCNVETTKSKNGKFESFIMFDRNKINKSFFEHDYIVLNPLEKLLKMNFMLTPAVIAKKSCFKDGIFFNEKRQYAEDWELWLNMSLHFTFGYVSDVCVHVRDEGDGFCSNEDKMLLSCLDIMEDFLKENISKISLTISKHELSQHIKNTYKSVGYYFATHKNKRLARKLFKKSLQEGFDIKTLLYYFKSLVPLS